MITRLSLVLLSATLGSVTAADQPSIIRFANEAVDQLSGTLESLTKDRVVWRSPILEKPTPFWLKDVLEVTLHATFPEFKATHEATLTLMNKDVVHGQVAAVTDDTVTLDTWYAGRLEFRRVMVKEVTIDAQPSLVFIGPVGMDGWIQSGKKPTWVYDNGSLRTNSNQAAGRPGVQRNYNMEDGQGIGRDVGLPDECSISFDVNWRGNLMMNFNFFTDDLTADHPANGYQLSCQGSYATISRRNAEAQLGDPASIPEFKEGEKARLEIRASRTNGNICFYVNGRFAALWKDTGVAKAKLGKGLQFVSQNGEMLRIAGIKVALWDGVLEDFSGEDPALLGLRMGLRRMQPGQEVKPKPKPVDDGRMKLRNGDSLGGEVTSIVDGVITVKTPFADVKLPVSRVRNIILKPASLEEPIRRNGDVRAWFGDGSSIVFCLDSLNQDTITGHSQTFGSATFKLAAFNRIEFNIYDPKITELRTKEGM